MYKQWVGCCAQNFQPGRAGFKPEAVVIHRTGGSLADIDARCSQAGTFSSAHYAVGTSGTVHQYVEESDTAFHAGIVVNPTWPLLKPGNPNLYTIGIELEGSAGQETTGAQYDAAAGLIAEIAGRCQFGADADHIVLHDEIRAGRNCPGGGFDRQQLLQRVQIAGAGQEQTVHAERAIRILLNSNVREGAPSTTARIVRVVPANSTEMVVGFTDQGERVQGNSYWYRTEDGNYFWAGSTDCPNPVPATPAKPVPLPASPAAAGAPVCTSCGISILDQLLAGCASGPLRNSDSNPPAIGAVQDLLTGLGFPGLPTVVSSAYGLCGPRTVAAIQSFQQQYGLDQVGGVDTPTLKKIVGTPAPDPRASTAYLALVLGFPAGGMSKILSLVSQMEGAGKFAAVNRNTDRAGLSFGLIQWAQKPGRLAEILAAMSVADRAQFVAVFGAGDAEVADALIAHCRKPFGGVDPANGETVNPGFNLAAEPWLSRFRQAALIALFQQAQVRTALAAFQASYDRLRRFAPDLRSERSAGFMIDVANQFGDSGAAALYAGVYRSGMAEMDVLESIADVTVQRVEDPFKAGVRARRDHFLQTGFLSGEPFDTGEPASIARAGA